MSVEGLVTEVKVARNEVDSTSQNENKEAEVISKVVGIVKDRSITIKKEFQDSDASVFAESSQISGDSSKKTSPDIINEIGTERSKEASLIKNSLPSTNEAKHSTTTNTTIDKSSDQSNNSQSKINDDFTTIDILPLVSEVSDVLLSSNDFFPSVVDTEPEDTGRSGYRVGRRSSSLMCVDVLGQCQVAGESGVDFDQYFPTEQNGSMLTSTAQLPVINGNFLTPPVPLQLAQELPNDLQQIDGIYQQVLINHQPGERQVAPLVIQSDSGASMHHYSSSSQLPFMRQECHLDHHANHHISVSTSSYNPMNQVTNGHLNNQQVVYEQVVPDSTHHSSLKHHPIHPHPKVPQSSLHHPHEPVTGKICNQNNTQQHVNTLYTTVYEDSHPSERPQETISHYKTYPIHQHHHHHHHHQQPYEYQPQYQILHTYDNTCPIATSFVEQPYQVHVNTQRTSTVIEQEVVDIAPVGHPNVSYVSVPVLSNEPHYYQNFCDSRSVGNHIKPYIEPHYPPEVSGYPTERDDQQGKTYVLLSKTTGAEQQQQQQQQAPETSCYSSETSKYPKEIPNSYDPNVELEGIRFDDGDSSDTGSGCRSKMKSSVKTSRSSKLHSQNFSMNSVCAPETIEKLRALLRGRQLAKEASQTAEKRDSTDESEEEDDDGDEGDEEEKEDVGEKHRYLSRTRAKRNSREPRSYKMVEKNKRRYVNNTDSNKSSSLSSPSSMDESLITDDTRATQELSSSSFADLTQDKDDSLNNRQLRSRTIIIKEPGGGSDSSLDLERLHHYGLRRSLSPQTRSSKRKHNLC